MTKSTAPQRKAPEPRIERSYDADKGIATLTYTDGRSVPLVVNGLPLTVLTHLAMVGAAELVSRRREPLEAWADIQAGHFGRSKRKEYPLVVQALAHHLSVTNEDASTRWSALSEDERSLVAKDPVIKRIVLSLQSEALKDQPSELASLLQRPVESGQGVDASRLDDETGATDGEGED